MNALDWNKKPARRKGPTGCTLLTWKTAGYMICKNKDIEAFPFVCFEYRSIHDTISDTTIIGWYPVGENRTLKAAKDRCQARRNAALSARRN